MVEYRGYEIVKEVRSEVVFQCPITQRYYTLPAEPRTFYHVYGKGVSWMALMPSMEEAKKLVDAAVVFGSGGYVEFYPGR